MALSIPIWDDFSSPTLAQSFSITDITTFMPQQTQRLVTQKTDTQLAHDALNGMVHQSVPPFSRPPPVQPFMDESEFKRFISRKILNTKMPNVRGQDADESIMNDEISKPTLRLGIMKRGAAIEEAARSHAARFVHSKTQITGNAVHVEQSSSLSKSTQGPQIAAFQSDGPHLRPFFGIEVSERHGAIYLPV